MKRLYLVDVSNMFFRAFYAIRPLTSPKGIPTNAIYGFVSMIIKLLKDEKPDFIAFCYDRPEPSFRAEIDPEYKAHRDETPEDLVPQIPYIKKFVEAFGVPAFEVSKYEADDIIGTLTKFGRRHGLEVTIVSGDKDFAQLVDSGVKILDTMKDHRMDEEGVKAKFGILPTQMIDYLSLIGDASDNIPGVEGIGPKGAQKLLTEFGSLDGIYENLEKIKSDSLREKLRVGKESAYLSKRLAEIVTDVPLNIELNDLRLKAPHKKDLRELLRDLNFKTFEAKLLGDQEQESPPGESEVSIESPSQTSTPLDLKLETIDASDLSQKIKKHDSVWGFKNERGYYLASQDVIYQLAGNFSDLGAKLSELQLNWLGFDLKSFWRDLQIYDPLIEWDSQLAAYIVLSTSVDNFQELCHKLLHKTLPSLANPIEEFHLHLELKHFLEQELGRVHGEKIYREVELPVAPVLLAMEQKGILIDLDLLSEQSRELTKDIRHLEGEIHRAAGQVFNIASPKQLAHILFDKMGLIPTKKTKTGFSTDNDVLEKLKADVPLAGFVLEYRELAKLKSTYVDALPALVNAKTGRVHSHFNQALTTTGRLSSTNPNLQNIPIRTPRGAAIRKAFVAPPGRRLLSADYSQIELRILAHISEDKGLCQAFADDLDIHAATAAEIFGVKLSDVTPEQRRSAKAVNFGIAYGQGAFGLAENLGIPRGQAQEIIKRYFEKFAGVQAYMESTIEQAKQKGYVTTIFGRRRLLPELKAPSPMIRKFGERAAINAPIQGSASDLVKMAMLNAAKIKNAEMLLQVHDELVFEVDANHADSVLNEVVLVMSNVFKLRVPLKVNGAIGKNWDEAH